MTYTAEINEPLKAGKVLTIEGKEYTVIENVQGTQYKVLTTDLANNRNTMQFDSNGSNDYATSTIATYLDNGYFDSLSENVRNAIVPASIQQKAATSVDWENSIPTWESEKDAGVHKVFLPNWDELIKAAGGTDIETLNTILGDDLKRYIWLRDINGNSVLSAHKAIPGFNGTLYQFLPDYIPNTGVNSQSCVRPTFVLDLSKVEYTIK